MKSSKKRKNRKTTSPKIKQKYKIETRHINVILCLLILITGVICFAYIFNKFIDINGDNAQYYIYARSIASGMGYSSTITGLAKATNNFPPGYSFLMTPLFWLSEEVVWFKIQNGFFLLLSSLLSYYIAKELTKNQWIALFVGLFTVSNFYLLKSATVMMSETSYMLFTLSATLYLIKQDKSHILINNKELWILLFLTVYAYHIRTIGLALIFAVLLHFVFNKEWRKLGFSTVVIIVGCIPWMLRNKILGLGGSRYIGQMMKVNSKRPELGEVSVEQFIDRMLDNAEILYTKSTINSMFPWYKVEYGWGLSSSFTNYTLSIILISTLLFGIYKMEKYRGLFLGYLVGISGLLLINNGGGGTNRYLTPVIPILYLLTFYGAYGLTKTFKLPKGNMSLYILLSIFILLNLNSLKQLKDQNQGLPQVYTDYFELAKRTQKSFPSDAKFCVRKPGLFHLYSNRASMRYKWSDKPEEVLEQMINQNLDYVIIAPLGYSSTNRYLVPTVNKYSTYFKQVEYIERSNIYLLKFDYDLARQELNL